MHLATLSPGRITTERRIWARWAARVREMVGREKKGGDEYAGGVILKKGGAGTREDTRGDIPFQLGGFLPSDVRHHQPPSSTRKWVHAYVINPTTHTQRSRVSESIQPLNG
jgi:hypothetical protein